MNITANCPLQDEILRKFCTDMVTPDEQEMLLRDLASGHDPIYQFVGFIATEGIVIDIYNEYKADVIEAIAELASYASYPEQRAARNVIGWQWVGGRQEYDVPETHADFAGRCLKIALDYHAGELASQLEG